MTPSDVAMAIVQQVVNRMTMKKVEPVPAINREARIDRFFIEVFGADSLEYLEFMFGLEAALGVSLSNEDWDFLSGGKLVQSSEEWEVKYAPMFTFGRLADLIAQRAELGTVAPVTVLGSTSLAAGAFRCIERIARGVDPKIEAFAPSTAILDRFHGRKLKQFWTLVRAVSGNRVPDIPESRAIPVVERVKTWSARGLTLGAIFVSTRIAHVGLSSGQSIDWASTVLLFVCILLMLLLPVCLILLALFPLGWMTRIIWDRNESAGTLFPRNIETFGDLARVLAGERGGWCEHCGYDLSGLAGRPCPECGTKPVAEQLSLVKKT